MKSEVEDLLADDSKPLASESDACVQTGNSPTESPEPAASETTLYGVAPDWISAAQEAFAACERLRVMERERFRPPVIELERGEEKVLDKGLTDITVTDDFHGDDWLDFTVLVFRDNQKCDLFGECFVDYIQQTLENRKGAEVIQHSGDNKEKKDNEDKGRGIHTVSINLKDMDHDIRHLVFVVSASRKTRLSDYTKTKIEIRDQDKQPLDRQPRPTTVG